MRMPFPAELNLQLAAKRPARLDPLTEKAVLAAPIAGSFRAAVTGFPDVSIVVLAHDNLVFTRMCVASVLSSAGSTRFELVVVDNGSTDGTTDYLVELASRDRRVRPLILDTNVGFAAGVNTGLRAARGRLFVLLNNDTIVAPGWLVRLLRHLSDRGVGLVGPVTNEAPGAARVSDPCATYGQFLAAAEARGRTVRARDVENLTLFCAAMTSDVYHRVGPLDERFEVGMFEDDDYCLRIAAAGLRCRLAEDVLVHHFGEASFGRLVPDGTWKAVFESNRRRFEEKWNRKWTGHASADDPAYAQLVERMRGLVDTLPDGAKVLVASRGDDRLCATDSGIVAGHFPQLADGTYAGSYPADDAAALALLQEMRGLGWTHLALPNPARWWLDHYPSLARSLSDSGVVLDDPGTGVVFRIGAPAEIAVPV